MLDQNGFGLNGSLSDWTKAIRTQRDDRATLHLQNSREMFNILLQISRTVNRQEIERYRQERTMKPWK